MIKSSFIYLSVVLGVALSTCALLSRADEITPASSAVVRHPRIGYCVHTGRPGWPVDQVIEAVAQSGASWIRDDFYWNDIEKTKGVYSFPTSERYKSIEAAHAAGLKVIAIFNIQAKGNLVYGDDPYNPDAYAKAAAWFAARTRGKVQAIEILNEPYGFGFRQYHGGTWNGMEKDGSASPWVGKYVELLNKAAKAIKAANPDVKVIGLGGVAPTNFRQLAIGVAPEVNGITDHPYSFRTVPELVPFAATDSILKRDGIASADERGTFASQIRMYREQSTKYKGPKELWLTEWGWTTYLETGESKYYSGFTENAQAKYTLRRLAESLGLGVETTMIYGLKDKGRNPEEAEDHFGVMDADFNPKPAYGAVRRFAAALAKYSPRETVKVNVYSLRNRPDTHPVVWDGAKLETSGRVAVYQFADEQGAPLIALWSTARADGDLNPAVADVEIEVRGSITAVSAYDVYLDQMRAVSFQAKPGRIILRKLVIPDSPLLITIQ